MAINTLPFNTLTNSLDILNTRGLSLQENSLPQSKQQELMSHYNQASSPVEKGQILARIDELGLGLEGNANNKPQPQKIPTPNGGHIPELKYAIVKGWDGKADISLFTKHDSVSQQKAVEQFDLPGAITILSHGGPEVYQKTSADGNGWAGLSPNQVVNLIKKIGGKEPVILMGCTIADRKASGPSGMTGNDYVKNISKQLNERPILAATTYIFTSPKNAQGWISMVAWDTKTIVVNGQPKFVENFEKAGKFKIFSGSASDYGIDLKLGQYIQGFRSNPDTKQSQVMIGWKDSLGKPQTEWRPWTLK
jgi:hypothetical protein